MSVFVSHTRATPDRNAPASVGDLLAGIAGSTTNPYGWLTDPAVPDARRALIGALARADSPELEPDAYGEVMSGVTAQALRSRIASVLGVFEGAVGPGASWDLAVYAIDHIGRAEPTFDAWAEHAPSWHFIAKPLLRDVRAAVFTSVVSCVFTDTEETLDWLRPYGSTRRRTANVFSPLASAWLTHTSSCAEVRRAVGAFDLAYVYFGSMFAVRSRDAAVSVYITAVATDERRLAGEPPPDRKREWFGGPSVAVHEQREAAQPREVRAGPSSSRSNSDGGSDDDPTGDHHDDGARSVG